MLEIQNFSKTYKGGKRAVSGLSLRVEPGSIVGFIGPNGAGKTTTIRATVGVLDFDEGDILIGGHSVRRELLRAKNCWPMCRTTPICTNTSPACNT